MKHEEMKTVYGINISIGEKNYEQYSNSVIYKDQD